MQANRQAKALAPNPRAASPQPLARASVVRQESIQPVGETTKAQHKLLRDLTHETAV